MQAVKSAKDIKKLGAILGIWAHPDDETFASAGLMSLAAQNGQKVACITATKGEEGVQDEKRWPKEELGQIRDKELQKSLETLGVKTHYWLGFKDGHCHETEENEAIKKIVKIIEETKPDTILTFGSDGLTGHRDHKTVSAWVNKALTQLSAKPNVYHAAITNRQYNNYLKKLDETLNIFFSIDKPQLFDEQNCQICLNLPDEAIDKKIAALKIQESQTAKLFDLFGQNEIAEAFSVEAFVLK